MLRLRPPFPMMSPERRIDFVERCFIATSPSGGSRASSGASSSRCCSPPSSSPSSATTRTPAPPRRPVTCRSPTRARAASHHDLANRPYPPLRVRTPRGGRHRAHQRGRRRGRRTAPPARSSRTGWQSAGGRSSCSSAAGTSTPRSSPRTSGGSSRASTPTAGCRCPTDARFQVLQGKCVGRQHGRQQRRLLRAAGPRAGALERPRRPRTPASTRPAGDGVRAAQGIRPDRPDDSRRPLAGGAGKFREGIKELGLDRDGDVRRGRGKHLGLPRLRLLQHRLPLRPQALGARLRPAEGAGRVRRRRPDLQRMRGREDHAARTASRTEVDCKLGDGRRLRVSANTVVVSAGAIASSLILQRSNVGGPNVGRGLSCNIGRAADRRVRREARRLRRPADLPLPARRRATTASSSRPGSTRSARSRCSCRAGSRDHYRNMRRYDRMASAGSVVGTRPGAPVKRSTGGGGMKLNYEPAPGRPEAAGRRAQARRTHLPRRRRRRG